MLVFAGTMRYETQAGGVSQLSLGVAWLLVTIQQGAQKESNVGPRVVGAPVVGKVWIDFTNGVNARKTVVVLWVLKKAVVNGCLN